MIENNGDEGDCTVSRIRCGSANEHPERRIKLHAESRGYSAVETTQLRPAAPYSAISIGGFAGPASVRSSISSMQRNDTDSSATDAAKT